MAESALTGLIVCVDESEYSEDGTLGYGNASNVFRLKALISTGPTTDHQSRYVNQKVCYYQAAADASQWKRMNHRSSVFVDRQIKQIVEGICRDLEGHQAEVFLYGSGRGAYIVQAVASLLHTLGRPKSMVDFDLLYEKALDLNKAFQKDDSLNGNRLTAYIKAHCDDPPKIQFLGVFDTLKTTVEKYEYTPSFVASIQNFRHALAFNDTHTTPFTLKTPGNEDLGVRSFIQAWFIGSHRDICGGSEHDGLSLFPLQWMILESMRAGLIFQSNANDSFLSITFPQFAGSPPTLESDEKAQWRLRYTNNIEITMFDLQSVHEEATKDGPDHSVRLGAKGFGSKRKMFNNDLTLIGWSATRPYGNVIHPSVFMMLDRNPRYYDRGIFKSKKRELTDFQERCLDDQGEMQPWLEGFSLQASGVKAFRILVCGKTGVGKSTLINKVFGVEMTEESTSYAQGTHDIDKAFESPNHPGLLVHDSRGWQAGSDSELDLIAKFLRHRAFQKNPAEALHIIWFCVDADVSRIEEADKRTLQTIAKHSSDVPVFVVGTKKDKLVAIHKMQLLDKYMERMGNYKEASRLANLEANEAAEKQFMELQDELSHDDNGIRKLLSDSLDVIADDRVRVFCVAAQVVDVEQKIDQAVTEVMRLATHAVRTAMGASLIGTPTVSRILVEQVLQCFGFPKAKPEAVEKIMSEVVMKHLKSFMKVSLPQFAIFTAGSIVGGPVGIGVVIGIMGNILSVPPAARMLFKCACDMILILERAFRYQGKYVSVKQLEDAAVYYTTETTKTFSGKEVLLQEHVHAEIERLIPLKNYRLGFKFGKLREGLQDIIYMNRYDMSEVKTPLSANDSDQALATRHEQPIIDIEGKALVSDVLKNIKSTFATPRVSELDSTAIPAELEGTSMRDPLDVAELEGDHRLPEQIHPDFISSRSAASSPAVSLRGTLSGPTTNLNNMDPVEPPRTLKKTKSKSSGNLLKKSMGMFRSKK
ncbi:hypothetical protein FHL15_010381 [Xylaria flabelliformis]|uniref:DUF2235 domain-containing protein n=1 Tax=Xylaria flabelliformis TaxID=2512241 RepID=A0A553HL77_9PEZI|nr:hypothetical protein FHL15_010381 [Xylaria flabelliformis]